MSSSIRPASSAPATTRKDTSNRKEEKPLKPLPPQIGTYKVCGRQRSIYLVSLRRNALDHFPNDFARAGFLLGMDVERVLASTSTVAELNLIDLERCGDEFSQLRLVA